MKSIKVCLPLLLLATFLAVAASAIDKDESMHCPTASLPAAQGGPQAGGGTTCSDAIVISSLPYTDLNQATCGRVNDYNNTCLGSYDGGEDIIYRLDLAAQTKVRITMDPLGNTFAGIAVDDACPPQSSCLDYGYSSTGTPMTIKLSLMAGSYYIMIDTYPPPACIPAFNLTVEEVTPYPNPTCASAIDIREQNLQQWVVNTCGSDDDYSPTNNCAMNPEDYGEDAVWKIYLDVGEIFSVALTDETYDAALYLLTDCLDINSCVAGGDNPDTFTYVATAAGVYYLIIDGHAPDDCGAATVKIETPVSTGTSTWGAVKALYR